MINEWKKVRELGSGGQGKVWLVEKQLEIETAVAKSLSKKLQQIQADLRAISQTPADWLERMNPEGSMTTAKRKPKVAVQSLVTSLKEIQQEINFLQVPSAAMKELHRPEDARDAEHAIERFRNEVEALGSINHPNVLSMLDVDVEKLMFVCPLYSGGTLHLHSERFKGEPLDSLYFLREIAGGVAAIHERGFVHRDLKPENIFIKDNGQPIIGDFGLVIDSSEDERLSKTYDNVGSRDWMPGWAQGIRYDAVKPAFDVFSLGKILWSLISGKPKLQLWYFDRPQSNLTSLFPNDPRMHHINDLLSKTVVEEEDSCLLNAQDFLKEINQTITRLELNGQVLSRNIERKCSVCAVGTYKIEVDGSPSAGRNFGISGAGVQAHLIFVCSHCGHTQVFSGSNHGEGIRLAKGWRE